MPCNTFVNRLFCPVLPQNWPFACQPLPSCSGALFFSPFCVSAAMAAPGSATCFSSRTTLPCRSVFRCRRIRHRLRRRSPPPGTDGGACRRSGCMLSRRRGDACRIRACWSGSLSYPVLPVVSEAASAPGLTLRSECICRCTSDDGDCYYCQKFHNPCILFTIQRYGRVLTTLVKSSKNNQIIEISFPYFVPTKKFLMVVSKSSSQQISVKI